MLDMMRNGEISQGGRYRVVLWTWGGVETNPCRVLTQVAWISEMVLVGDILTNNLRVASLFLRYRKPSDTGVWNGHSYEDIPAATTPM